MKSKTQTRKNYKKRHTKTKKMRNRIIKSKTPKDIERVSLVIANSLRRHGSAKGIENPIPGYARGYGKKMSYAPTINQILEVMTKQM